MILNYATRLWLCLKFVVIIASIAFVVVALVLIFWVEVLTTFCIVVVVILLVIVVVAFLVVVAAVVLFVVVVVGRLTLTLGLLIIWSSFHDLSDDKDLKIYYNFQILYVNIGKQRIM